MAEKFYSIGHADTLDGDAVISTGTFALNAADTNDNITHALNAENLFILDNVEAEYGPVMIYELVPVGSLREVLL